MPTDNSILGAVAGYDMPRFSLVTKDTCYGKDLYRFSHPTFEEFLAACHITTLEKKEKLKVIGNDCSGKKQVLKFYCGIQFNCSKTNFAERDIIFEKVLTLHDDSLFRCQCVFESQQFNSCMKVVSLQEPNGLAFSDHTFHASDFISINYVIKNTSQYFHKLSLSGCIIAHCVEALIETLRLCVNLRCLDLSNNNIDDIIAHKLKECLMELKHLEIINLSHNLIGSDGVQAIADGICTKLTTLELFGRSKMKIGSTYMKANSESLQRCLNYKGRVANIAGLDNIDADSAKALGRSLGNCESLEELKLQWSGIGDEGIGAIVENLKSDNISTLEFFGSKITDVDTFSSLLRQCNKLTTLDLILLVTKGSNLLLKASCTALLSKLSYFPITKLLAQVLSILLTVCTPSIACGL